MNRIWLINVRKQQKLSQQQVAAASNIDRAYYSQIETGKRDPSMDVAMKISDALGFHPSVFFMEYFDEPFQLALKDSPMIIAHCDSQLRYTWIFNPHPDFDPQQVIGKRDDELARNHGTKQLMELKMEVIVTGMPVRREIVFPLSDGDQIYDVFGKPLFDADGRLAGVATSSTCISERAE